MWKPEWKTAGREEKRVDAQVVRADFTPPRFKKRLDRQPRDAAELILIARHHAESVREGGGGESLPRHGDRWLDKERTRCLGEAKSSQ